MAQSDMNDMMGSYLSKLPKKRHPSRLWQEKPAQKEKVPETGKRQDENQVDVYDERPALQKTLDRYAVRITSLFRRKKKEQQQQEEIPPELQPGAKVVSEHQPVDPNVEKEFDKAESVQRDARKPHMFKRIYYSIIGKNWEDTPPKFITEKQVVHQVAPEVHEEAQQAEQEMEEIKEEKEKEEKVAGVLSEFLGKIRRGKKKAEEKPSPEPSALHEGSKEEKQTYQKVMLYKPELDRDMRRILKTIDSFYGEIPEEVRRQFEKSEDYVTYQGLLRKYKIRW